MASGLGCAVSQASAHEVATDVKVSNKISFKTPNTCSDQVFLGNSLYGRGGRAELIQVDYLNCVVGGGAGAGPGAGRWAGPETRGVGMGATGSSWLVQDCPDFTSLSLEPLQSWANGVSQSSSWKLLLGLPREPQLQ